jgi:hypothetical protein
MKKMTVYLTDEEARRLGELAAATGESQAGLIREGVRRLLPERRGRTFHSMGKGAGGGERRPRWNADAAYEKIRTRCR